MKTFIEESYGTNTVKVFLMDDHGDKRVFYYFKDGQLHGETINRLEPVVSADPIPPFLELPHHFFNEVSKAMANHVINKGFSTENEHKLQGELQATKLHLDDVRKHLDKALFKLLAL